jgi:YggT family protein
MIRFIIDLYILIIVIDAVLSFLPQLRQEVWVLYIRQISGYSVNPVRKLLRRYIPDSLPFDISPLIVILGLKLFVALF